MRKYCGIDLHSTKSYVAILGEDQEKVAGKWFRNDVRAILKFLEPHRSDLIGVAVESTFNWYFLVDALRDADYLTFLVNTNKAKQYDGLKFSDDKNDAFWIAEMLSLGILPTGYIYPKEERPLRDVLRRRGLLVGKRTSIVNSMRSAFERSTGIRVKGTALKAWTEDEIADYLEMPEERLGIECMQQTIKSIDQQIKKIETAVLKQAKLRKEFRELKTVWGIGNILALTIMYEVGEIERFPSVGNFVSYCRLVQSGRWSVNKKKGTGNRKNGNRYLSWAFSEVASHAQRHYEPARQFYQRKLRSGLPILANRALAHKLARASFFVMRDNVSFEPKKLFGSLLCK